MPRQPRHEDAGGYYHVTARGNGGEPIFLDGHDFMRFVGFMSRAVQEYEWRCFAYCAMPNHFHVVLQLTRESLASGMRWLCGAYARTFNNRRARTGHLFGGRYRTGVIDGERHLVHACRYVECNPVRAGLCAQPQGWRWSSYRASAGLCPAPTFLSSDAVTLAGGPEAYAAFAAEVVGARKAGQTQRV
jgi:putative transposase